METVGYKRISSGGRAGTSLFTTTSTWVAPDHLLIVTGDGYTETYKRVFFRDIQSIVIRRDSRRKILNIVFGAILAVIVFIGYFAPDPTSIWYALGIGGIFCGIPILYNSLRGPTCVTHVRTPIQFVELQGLRRLRAAQMILQRTREIVAAGQPLLTQEDIARGVAAAMPTAPNQRLATPTPSMPLPPQTPSAPVAAAVSQPPSTSPALETARADSFPSTPSQPPQVGPPAA